MSNSVRNSDGDLPVAPSLYDAAMLIPSESILNHEAEKKLAEHPNDVARLVYLTSIRDCNTGVYLEPELSRRYGTAVVDQILRLHHERVFQNLLETPVCTYVDQLRLYISFAHVPRAEFIKTWKDLKSYNSAVPLQCDKLAAELFCWNVESALCILEQTG